MEQKRDTSPSWVVFAARLMGVFMIMAVLVSCGQGSAAQPATAPTSTVAQAKAPTETVAPPAVVASATPMAPASPTPTFTESPTATLEPTATPTASPVPALAVVADGFNAWCAPLEVGGTQPVGLTAEQIASGPGYARKLQVKDQKFTVPIPASYCVLLYRFNQPAPKDAVLVFSEGKNAFLKLNLQPMENQPDQAWAAVSHIYVVNPPLWFVNYSVSVDGPDGKELWSNLVTFAKPLPKPCKFGGLPDPVTMYCTPTDPWEIEPWPDVHYPYPSPTPH